MINFKMGIGLMFIFIFIVVGISFGWFNDSPSELNGFSHHSASGEILKKLNRLEERIATIQDKIMIIELRDELKKC